MSAREGLIMAAANAAEAEVIRQYRRSDWDDAKEVAEGLDFCRVIAAALAAIEAHDALDEWIDTLRRERKAWAELDAAQADYNRQCMATSGMTDDEAQRRADIASPYAQEDRG